MAEQSNNAQSYLDMLEGIHTMVSTLDQIRQGLVDKGWDDLQAQTTARLVFEKAMETSIAKIQTGQE